MSDELWVLCRERPVLRSGEPAGLTWDPDASRGTYRGADVLLTDIQASTPTGDTVVAVLGLSWTHRTLAEAGTLSLDDFARQIAADSHGEVFDPHEDERSPLVTAYIRERDAAYARERDILEAARTRVEDRPLPQSTDELRQTFASVILSEDASEPRVIDPDASAMFHRIVGGDHSGSPGAFERNARFEEFVLALARERARIARGDHDLQTMFASYGLRAARKNPELRPELEEGGPLARAICERWRSHDAHRVKQRAWLRRSWPAVEKAELASARTNDPVIKALRRSSKQWPDELVDELIDACDRSVVEWRARHVGPFVERFGLESHHADRAIQYILLNRPRL